jgi:hypothetical protein
MSKNYSIIVKTVKKLPHDGKKFSKIQHDGKKWPKHVAVEVI